MTMSKSPSSPLARLSKPQQSRKVEAITATHANPEKLMILMFPAITLGAFAAGVIGYYLVPKVVMPMLATMFGG